MSANPEEKLLQILHSHAWFMHILETVAACNLPDWGIGAGVLRNIVWDYLRGGHHQPAWSSRRRPDFRDGTRKPRRNCAPAEIAQKCTAPIAGTHSG